jgi:two-component system sensor histidine kinase ChvG
VENEGPPLPGGMEAQLFDSMVSLRDAAAPRRTHLGLGLFIVRLVAQAHGGTASARNLAPGSGVSFGIEVPLG